MKRNRIKTNRFRNSICPQVMIGDYPIVMKGVVAHVEKSMTMSSIHFINSKGNFK